MFERWLKKSYRYENTRRYPRLPAAWPIRCTPEAAPPGNPHVTATRDVSAGGVAMVAREMVPVGSRIRIEIHALPLNRTLAAHGQVVRCLPMRRGGFDLGIRFLEIDPRDRADLNGAIETLLGPRSRAKQGKSWWRRLP